MKTQTRLALLAILSFALAVIPAAATTYSNGPCNCDLDAFNISGGYIVTDSFTTPRWSAATTSGSGRIPVTA